MRYFSDDQKYLLKKALSCFVEFSSLDFLSEILIVAREKGYVLLFREVVEVLGSREMAEDILFLAYDWRLLIPRLWVKSGQWDSRLLEFDEEEKFEAPEIIRILINEAVTSGKWNLTRGIRILFKNISSLNPERVVTLIKNLTDVSVGYRINVSQIKVECVRAGIKIDMVDLIIALFKGFGIFSPALGYLGAGYFKEGPVYELNPSLIFC